MLPLNKSLLQADGRARGTTVTSRELRISASLGHPPSAEPGRRADPGFRGRPEHWNESEGLRCGVKPVAFGSDPGHGRVWSFRSMRQAAGAAHALTGHTLHLMVSSLDGHRSHLNRDRTAVYSTSGISKSFLVKNSTRPVATAAGFLPGKSWLAHGIDTVSISGIHC